MEFSRIGKAISWVVIFTLIAKFLGFFREILLSFFFGATGVSDAYLISQNIPGTIFQFVGTGLMTSFIPIYFEVKNKYGIEAANKFTNRIITLVFIFSSIVICIIWLFTPWVVKLFASGFSGQTFYFTMQFTRIGVLSLYFSSLIYVYNSYLQANHVFGPVAFAAIPYSVFIMLSIVLGAVVNIWILSIGSTLAVGGQLLFLLYPVYKLGFHLKLSFSWHDFYIRRFFYLFLPVVFGVSVNEINTLIDRTVASQVAVGGISALTYANSLIMLIQGGIVQPVSTVFYPQITSYITQKQISKAIAVVEKAINSMLTILIPISIGFMIYSRIITNALFSRGAFDQNASIMTAEGLFFYAIGICFLGIREILSRFYYANSNTKIPMKNATLGVIVNIILNLLLSRFLGIAGLASATTISAIITSFLLWKDCDKYLHSGRIQINVKDFAKSLFASIVSVAVAFGISELILSSDIIKLLVGLVISIPLYIIIGLFMSIEFIQEAVSFGISYVKKNSSNRN